MERKCESEIIRSERFADTQIPVPEVFLLFVVSAKPVAVIHVHVFALLPQLLRLLQLACGSGKSCNRGLHMTVGV
jgi:hypothetical protein